MATLSQLDENIIVGNLKQRYTNDTIHVRRSTRQERGRAGEGMQRHKEAGQRAAVAAVAADAADAQRRCNKSVHSYHCFNGFQTALLNESKFHKMNAVRCSVWGVLSYPSNLAQYW